MWILQETQKKKELIRKENKWKIILTFFYYSKNYAMKTDNFNNVTIQSNEKKKHTHNCAVYNVQWGLW